MRKRGVPRTAVPKDKRVRSSRTDKFLFEAEPFSDTENVRAARSIKKKLRKKLKRIQPKEDIKSVADEIQDKSKSKFKLFESFEHLENDCNVEEVIDIVDSAVGTPADSKFMHSFGSLKDSVNSKASCKPKFRAFATLTANQQTSTPDNINRDNVTFERDSSFDNTDPQHPSHHSAINTFQRISEEPRPSLFGFNCSNILERADDEEIYSIPVATFSKKPEANSSDNTSSKSKKPTKNQLKQEAISRVRRVEKQLCQEIAELDDFSLIVD